MSKPSGTRSQRTTREKIPTGMRAIQQMNDRKAQSEAAKAVEKTKPAPTSKSPKK